MVQELYSGHADCLKRWERRKKSMWKPDTCRTHENLEKDKASGRMPGALNPKPRFRA